MDSLAKFQEFVRGLDGIKDSVGVAYLRLTDEPERTLTAGDLRVLLAALRLNHAHDLLEACLPVLPPCSGLRSDIEEEIR